LALRYDDQMTWVSDMYRESLSNEFVLYPDSYDDIREMMEKSPFGIRIMHDGQNVLSYKPVVK